MDKITNETIKKAAKGDIHAFEELYQNTSEYVYNVAWRVINKHEDVEEVVQEVFLLIYRKLKDFRFEASFKTWVYRITVNTAIDYLRKTSPEKEKTVGYSEQIPNATVPNEIEEKINDEYRKKTVKSVLKILSPEQRTCIVLRNIEDLSYQEIANILEININTVRSRLRRARETLLSMRKEVLHHEL